MSPRRTRPSARRQRGLVWSLVAVVVIAVGSFAATVAAGWSPQLGLDLAGGFSVVYQPARHISQSDLNETVNLLNNRVNSLGVSGATVSAQGKNQEIAVDVPGAKNAQAEEKKIGQTAQLYFRPTLCYAPAYAGHGKNAKAATSPKLLPQQCPSANQLVTANLQGTTSSRNGVSYPYNPYQALANYPSTNQSVDDQNKDAVVLLPGVTATGAPDRQQRYLLGPAELTGRAVKSAVAEENPSTGQWVVNMSLTSSGSTGWDAMAKKYFHEIIGIELDGLVQSAPITQPTQSSFSSFNGQVQISGNFTQASAQNLAQALNEGSLPVPLKQKTSETVSPTLGKSSLEAGLIAGIAGLILVLIYTIIYYRLLGIVVVAGLAVTAALLWAIISALGHTSVAPSFDLAGVTGLIVSVGITVDSYIVYFERLKDETRTGRTVRTSVDRGFKSAFRTVLAADLVSLIGAAVLYFVAIGDVQGFAFFLGLSTLLDIIVTYFFTRPLVILLGRNERLTEAKTIGISRGLAVEAGAEA